MISEQKVAETRSAQGPWDEGLRVVIAADNASARFGGEALLPLQYFRRLRARGIEAWLVVHERVRRELEETLPGEVDRIHYVPDRPAQVALSRLRERLPDRLAFLLTDMPSALLTQKAQCEVIRRLVREHGVNVVHVPGPVSPRAPSAIHGVDAPVVIGPMNGGMSFPPGFRGRWRLVQDAATQGARAFAGVANRAVPGKVEATALLVANPRTRDALPPGTCTNVIELVENAVDLALFDARPRTSESPTGGRVRLSFIGRLVDWKGLDLLLEALHRAMAQAPFELHVLGEGPERAALEAQAQRLGLSSRVTFHGYVPQERCAEQLASSDALVLPSLFESGGAVVLEAMAMGVAVVATRWGGPQDYLTDDTGMLVHPRDRESFVQGLCDALVQLATVPGLKEDLGARGRARIRTHYDWERKIDQMLDVYARVRAAHADARLAAGELPVRVASERASFVSPAE